MIWGNYYIVYDIETGGFSCEKNPVLEFACIVYDCNLKEVQRYETYIKPYKGKGGVDLFVSDEALKVNGISMRTVEEKGIDIKQFYKDIIAIFKKYKVGRFAKPVLVGHNICAFDNKWIDYILELIENKPNPLKSYTDDWGLDTMGFSRLKWGNVEVDDHKLGSACKRFGIDVIDAHRAMNDVEGNSQLFINFAQILRNQQSSSTIAKSTQPQNRFRTNFQF